MPTITQLSFLFVKSAALTAPARSVALGAGAGAGVGALLQLLRRAAASKAERDQISVLNGALIGAGLGGVASGGAEHAMLKPKQVVEGASPSTTAPAVVPTPTPSWLTGNVRGVLAGTLPTAALQTLNKGVMNATMNERLLVGKDAPLLRSLNDSLRSNAAGLTRQHHVQFSDVPSVAQSAATFGKVTQPGALFGKNIGVVRAAPHAHPGILAHELGHLRQGKTDVGLFNAAPKALGNIGFLASLFQNNEADSALASGASAIMHGVTLQSELSASAKGRRMLLDTMAAMPTRPQSSTMRRVGRSPFAGVPTYALAAAAPILTHLTRKHFGAFDTPAQQP